jgi:membrane protein YqaA with SNARE-associated domain
LSAPKFFLKYTAWLAALKTLGAWGVFIIAILDSAAFGIPMDPLVAGYVYATPHKAWLYCLAGALGSALGSIVPYALGRAGGELFLLKRIDEAKLQRIRDRFERQEFLALMVPAMLPPPTPFKLFVFSAGVFEMKPLAFLLAVISGRLVRFGVLSVLTVIFGPQIVAETKNLIRTHPSFLVLIAIGLILAAYMVYRLLRQPAKEIAEEIKHEDEMKHT